jgi:hypothetical protein
LTNAQITRLLYRAEAEVDAASSATDADRAKHLLEVADAYVRIAAGAVSALRLTEQNGGLL